MARIRSAQNPSATSTRPGATGRTAACGDFDKSTTAAEFMGSSAWRYPDVGTDRTQRNPRFPALLSGVLELRAATRYRLQYDR